MGFFNNIISPFVSYLPDNNRYERIWKLALVDFKKRYYNTRLGLVWALINPIFRLFIYLFVFTWLGKIRMENFGFYIFGALILWMSFTECTTQSIDLFRKKLYLIQNVQLNIMDLFLAKVISVFLGLAFNLGAYLCASLVFGIPIYMELIWVPFLLIIHFFICLGASMILAVLGIYIKDITHLWTMVIMLGFWTIPAIFPLEAFTGKLQYLLYVNPVGGIIINMRNALLYGQSMDFTFLIHCTIYSLSLYIIGQYLLKKHWRSASERL